ncbi:hypothetical protein MRX96_046547 [Rhipicephalus microplus]
MAARKPTHAYVQYKDGDSAIVSVSLIKHYSPDDVIDLASNKVVCWRKNRKGYLSESYFRGDILTLGCGMDNLVSRKLRQGRIVPEQVFEESCQGTRLKKSTLQDTKQICHHSKLLKKPGKGKILGKRRREDLDSGTDEEDELVPCRRFQEAKGEIAELEGRLRVSRERLHKQRQRDIKLHILLDYKMDSMEASIIALIKLELHGTRPASQLFGHGSYTGPSVCIVEVTLDDDRTSVVHWNLDQKCSMAGTTSGGSFAEAAVYLVSLLPWPWDNMSIMLETAVDGDPTPQYDEPHLVQYPTMGPTAVAFWHLFSPIPVNFKLGKDHFVPASAFAASWALGYDVATINSVLAKIQVHGLFNNVGRWVFKAPSFAVSHAGIMATQKVQLIDVPAEEGSVKPLPPNHSVQHGR